MGAAGQAWLAGLPSLLADPATEWSITVGAPLDGGRASYVAEATTRDGTPAALKVSIPPGMDEFTPFDRQLAALQLADGDPYVKLIRHDVPRQALLLERLGRLPTGAEAARWDAAFIPAMGEDLAQPCSRSVMELAVRCAAAREASYDPRQAVLVHGDVHALNTLQKPGSARADADFRLVAPGGLVSEPAHDLGVIQARGVQGRLDELAASDPQQALEMVTGSCRQASRIPGVDAEAIWQWAYTELVSTGLHVLRHGDRQEAETFLAAADKLAAATAKAKPPQTRTGEPLTPLWVTGERRPTREHHRPSPEPDDVRPEPAKLLLMVGLPGAGKTTRAQELAATHRALRLTPDEWMISLFDGSQPDGKRDLLEGRLIALALQALHLGTNVVLDFGLWSRDERSALRWLATSAGASCHVIYLPVDTNIQRARIAHRQATAPHTTFPMTDADIDRWRKQFQAPDAAELRGGRTIPGPPPGWPGWPEWAADRWPSLDPSRPSLVHSLCGQGTGLPGPPHVSLPPPNPCPPI